MKKCTHILWYAKCCKTQNIISSPWMSMMYMCDFIIVNILDMCVWLVVDLPLWKIWVRQLGLLFPTEWKVIKFRFQTTNQVLYFGSNLSFVFDKLPGIIVVYRAGRCWPSCASIRIFDQSWHRKHRKTMFGTPQWPLLLRDMAIKCTIEDDH